ncbi:MAG: ribose 5-phosphate isomerase A [Thalassobius sp.]|nr:ribose 5-phosphate isomerase A [Thalassovita sp.]
MNWNSKLVESFGWNGEIKNKESKAKIAKLIADKVKDGDVIGFGSGSTSYMAILEIAEKIKKENLDVKAIPTSHEIEILCIKLGIPTIAFNDGKPDWGFDGADEIDPQNSLIKGRGGAMFREKLIMAAAEKTYILADKSKLVNTLGEKFPVPVETVPSALASVESALLKLGASEITLRLAAHKDGPVITENGNFILDVKFNKVSPTLEKDIKLIPGVLESGLFMGFNVEIVTD